jgi:two-component system response regulator FixJ
MCSDFAIHIVDDDPDVRESLKTLVEHSGYPAYCYGDGQGFLDQCESTTGCALIDLRLEGMDGIELLKKMNARQVGVDVMMISAYGDIKQAVKAMRLGAIDFLEKPYEPDQLLTRIRELSLASDPYSDLQREARQRAALIETLTAREMEVLSGIVDGQSNKRVAINLGLSPRTVETHRLHIMQKLQADSLAHLVRIWIAAGA